LVSVVERLGLGSYFQSRMESCCESMIIASAAMPKEAKGNIGKQTQIHPPEH
jgi:hypothetical protein